MKETTNYVVKKRLSFLLLSKFSNFKKSIKSVLVVPLLLFIFLFAQQSFAVVNVTFTGTAANATFTAGSPYANMAAAVTAMNASMASTTGSGSVVFTATANETVPNGTGLYITATGSATIGLVIDGAGFTFTAGTNTAGGNLDAVFKIVGGDYITIQNCVIQENAANIVTATGATNTMTEAGILLIHASATNGASNNTIQNNTITLSASYANAVGILSTSGSTTTNASPGANTTAAATSTAGTNSSNKFYGNVISNVQYGFLILCPPVTATVNESGNDIGGTSTTTGNRITFGVNSAASGPWNLSPAGSKAGILCRNAGAISIRYNTITSISTLAESVAGAGVNGIAMSFGTGPTIAHTTTISNNTINIYQTGSTAVQGIDFGHSSGGGSANATYVASDNNITINHSTTTASTAGVVTGIKMSYTTATKTINKDTITIKQSVSGAGTFTGIVNYVNISAVATTANVTNCLFNTTGSNILSTGNLTGIFQDATVTTLVNMKGNTVNVSRTAASGSVFFTSTSGTPSEVADTISNNNITFTGLAGTTAVTVISSLGGPTSPVVGNKSICGNTINVTGSNSGTIIGITAAFTNTGNINANNITMSTASPNTTGITTSGTAMTMVNNTLSLTTSTTSLTSITGIAASSGTGTFNINNNTISALNASGIITTATNIYGISYSGTGTNTVNINNNRISGVSIGASTSSASPNIAAINVTGGVTTMSKNKICDISTLCTGATTIVSGIRLSSTTASANMVVSNNYIGNLTATVSTNTDAIRGINILSTSATATISVFYNTIYINSASTAATSGSSGIFHTISATATTAALDLRNNIIVNTSTPQGAGLTVAYRRSAGAANNLANYSSNSNNNLFYAGTPGASRLIYSDGTSTGQTLALYKAGVFTAGTIAPRDAASVTEDPTSFFVSTTCGNAGFLHITAGSTTQIESGAVSPNTTTYATDYDGDIRQGSAGYPAQTNGGGTAPDIGADEGDFRPAKPSITLNSITPSTTQCTATARAISVNVTTPSPTTISSVTISYNNGAAAGPLAMSNPSGTTWTYTIPAASPTNTTVTWSVTATNNLGFSTTYTGGTYQDNPNVGITATATARPTTVCSGAADTLSVIINKSGTGVIGSGSVNSSSSPTPFSGTYGGMKGQYIILASELTAAGYTAGNITAIGINFVSSVTATYTGLTIQIGNTALSAFPGTLSLESLGLATYYGPTNLVNPTAGVNTFTLSSSFYWDGTSNIIISTNWSNNTTTSTAASVVTTTTAFNSAQVHKRDSYTPAALLALTGTQVGGSSVVGTARPNFTITGNTAPAPTTYVWSDGASTVSTTNPGYVNPTANPTNYTCTATVSGCPLVSNTVAVTVVSLPTAPTLVGNSVQCGTGVPTASVSGAATLRWYDLPTGGTVLQSGGTTYASSISTTDTFYVSSFNGTCESARTMVIATVNAPDALTASASSTTIACLGNSTNLSVSQTGSSQSYTLIWTATPSAGSGIPTSAAGALGTPLTITPTLAGSYRYTITGVDGACTTFDTIRVTVNNPNVGITAVATAQPTTVCSGEADTLSVVVTKNATVTLGVGGSTSTLAPYNPFNGGYGGMKGQYLIRASELTALGLTAGNITGLTLYVSSVGTTYNGFVVQIGNTALTALTSSTIQGSLTTVKNSFNITPTAGANAITFDTPFSWNGTSNIIVSTSWSNNNASNASATIFYDATAFQSSVSYRKDNETAANMLAFTGATGAGTFTYDNASSRPRLSFTGNTAPAATTYVWSDGASTVSTTNPGYVNPTVNPTNYTCTATVSGCPVVSNTVAVTVVSLPTAPTLVGNSVQCGAGVPTASVSGAATLRWYDLPTGGTVLQSGGTTYASSISATDTFYVSSFNGTCESARTMVIATVNAPDALTASASSTTIACLGNSTDLSVAQTGSSQSYTLTWTATPSAGSGIPTSAAGALGTPLTITPTAAGSYRYTITGVDGACTTFDTIRVTVNDPNAGATVVATARPTTICTGDADTLTLVVAKNGTVSTGAGASTSSSAGTSPFYHGYGGQKAQYIYRASELTAMGLTAGNLTALSLNITSLGTTNMSNFSISIGHTAQNAAVTNSAITTGLTTVYNSASQTLTSGTNTYTFGAAFNWNGTSNLVISFNYSNVNSGGTSSTVTTDAAGFTSTLGIYADNSTAACLFAAPASAQACMGLSSNTTTSNRPTLTITGNKVQTPASFTWSDGASIVSTTNPGYVNPTVNPTNYTCTATVSGCPVVSNTVAVTVVPLPTTPTLVGNSTQCGPGVPTASVSGAATLKWYLVPTGGTAVQTGGTTYATSISATDTFYVSSNNGTCESARTMVIATVTVPDSIIAYAGGTGTSGGTSSPPNITACPNTALNLYVLKNSGTNSYNYTWSCATAGNGISTSTGNNISVTPTAAGLFNYIVTANDPISGCNNVDTVRVRVIPTSITATALATNLCGAGSSTTISIPSTGLGTSTVQWQKDSSGTWVNVGTDSTTLVTPNLDTTTSFRALVKVGGSTCLTSNTVTINVNNVAITSTTPASRCTPGTLTLSATGTSGSTIRWYTDPTGGTLLQTGTSFTTPSLSSTTDYYVEAVNGTTSVTSNVGPNSPNDGIGSFGTSFTGTYQVFDVAATMVLNSVDVFATTTGTVIVELLNSSGTVINTAATYNVTAGQANSTSTSVGTAITIPINFTIPAGTGYELTLKSTSTATILRNDGGMASYYNIVGSEPTFTDNWLFDIDYWYDFYKWNVTVTGACASVRTLVTATVAAPTTNPTVTATQTICQDSIVLLTASGSTSSPTTLLFEGFESNPPAGFNLNTNGTFSDFYVEPYYIEGAQSIGLVSDSWDGTNIRITQSSPINLSSYTNAELTFYHICASEPGYDYGYVQYSTDNGGSWTSFPTSAYTGGATLQNSVVSFDASSYSDWNTQFYDEYQDPGTAPATSLWKRESINLTPYIGTTQFKVRFRMTYDFYTDYYGWLIDSVHIAGTKTVKYAWTPKTRLYTNPAATVAYDSITTPDTDTVYAKPNDTITYTALAYTQIPSACFGSNTVTVNVSKKPTAIIDSVKLYICDGSAILKASSVTPPSSSLNWTNISGSGSSSVSGNPATVTGLTAGTSIYQLKATNGQCIDIPIGKDTIVTPTTVPSTVSTTNSCNLCIYTDGTTKTFYNSTDGKIIGTIQDDAAVTPAELGETEMCLDIAGSVPSVVDNFGLNQPYLQRRWTIKPTTNTNSIITLYFTTAELTALQAAANTTRYQFSGYDLYVTKFDGGGNGTFTPPCTGGTGGCGMVTGRSVPAVFGAYNGDHFVSFTINSFSTFYVHPALFPFAPLPVELISFNGWNAGAVNQLQWKTASEKNTAKFIVEKSIDGVTYTSIGEQTAAGNSTTTLSYSLSDNQPVIGNNYYRLKTVDIDGKFSYSDVINIPVNEAYTNSFTRVYPNPTKGNLNVEIQSSTTSNTKIVVFDVVGKKIFEKETSLVKGINTLTFDVADYADGAYILQFIDSTGKTHTSKFVKK